MVSRQTFMTFDRYCWRTLQVCDSYYFCEKLRQQSQWKEGTATSSSSIAHIPFIIIKEKKKAIKCEGISTFSDVAWEKKDLRRKH